MKAILVFRFALIASLSALEPSEMMKSYLAKSKAHTDAVIT